MLTLKDIENRLVELGEIVSHDMVEGKRSLVVWGQAHGYTVSERGEAGEFTLREDGSSLIIDDLGVLSFAVQSSLPFTETIPEISNW